MINRFECLSVLAVAVLSLVAVDLEAQDPAPGPGASVIHVVFVWLKEPGNAEHRARIIEASRAFEEIDGVLEVRVGEPVASDRPVVDDSFDVGIYLRFATARDMRDYLEDERHRVAVTDVLRPLTARYLVYDIADGGVMH